MERLWLIAGAPLSGFGFRASRVSGGHRRRRASSPQASNGLQAEPLDYTAGTCAPVSESFSARHTASHDEGAGDGPADNGVPDMAPPPPTEVDAAEEWRPLLGRAGLKYEAIDGKCLRLFEQLEEMGVCKPDRPADAAAGHVNIPTDSANLPALLGEEWRD